MGHFSYTKVLALWLGWLLVGTVFYSIQNKLGWSKGFYMAVNVGYSIGWGYPVELSDNNIRFSIVYVLLGASAVAASLGYFAQSMVHSSKGWYHNENAHSALVNEKNPIKRALIWARFYQDQLTSIAIWVVWIFCMALYSCYTVGWSVTQGIYYAVASCSTGGLWAIPHDSPSSAYVWTGFFAACGVPIMALAMGSAAKMFMTIGDPEADKKTIVAKVTRKELEMMVKFGLENGDGTIDRSEYILLCAVRLGALKVDLIKVINDRFDQLDVLRDGVLSYAEILEEEVFKEEFELIDDSTLSVISRAPTDTSLDALESQLHPVPKQQQQQQQPQPDPLPQTRKRGRSQYRRKGTEDH